MLTDAELVSDVGNYQEDGLPSLESSQTIVADILLTILNCYSLLWIERINSSLYLMTTKTLSPGRSGWCGQCAKCAVGSSKTMKYRENSSVKYRSVKYNQKVWCSFPYLMTTKTLSPGRSGWCAKCAVGSSKTMSWEMSDQRNVKQFTECAV